MATISLEIIPRPQFRAYLKRLERWACLVVHRRGGKTFCCIQDLIARSLTHKRKGPPLRYGYIAPTRDQAKDIAWGYLKRFTSTLPKVRTNEADLSIILPNSASIRLYSGDSYERMRGLYFDGVVIDEMGDIDPAAWHSVVRPCLSDYQGWATFIGTPKGRNEFWRLHNRALSDEEWFSLVLKASESGLIPDAELADIRGGSPEHIYKQEYECDFSVGMPGAIYASELDKARADSRIGDHVAYYEGFPVYTAFDIGAPANQKVWIFQAIGDRIKLLESLSGGEDCKMPAHWAARLKAKKYRYGGHFLPHDGEILWRQQLMEAGLVGVGIVPRQLSVWDGINDALTAFSRCEFNSKGCADGIDALEAYHSKEESDGITIKDVPVHDWASHYSDAFSIVHQAIRRGMLVDRSAIPSRPRSSKPKVLAGVGGSMRKRPQVRR